MAEKCDTCVFYPGDRMHLGKGRFGEIIRDNLEADAALQCHKTLSYSSEKKPGAICRGFYDGYRGRITALRLAEQMWVIEFDV